MIVPSNLHKFKHESAIPLISFHCIRLNMRDFCHLGHCQLANSEPFLFFFGINLIIQKTCQWNSWKLQGGWYHKYIIYGKTTKQELGFILKVLRGFLQIDNWIHLNRKLWHESSSVVLFQEINIFNNLTVILKTR